ncbi:MAG: beta-lactamase family protein [Clostridiales bacterium]|nr:beta-lactamase family protein [Clostridiales bacterium]
MTKQQLYRLLIHAVPPKIVSVQGHGLTRSAEQELLKLLRRHRCRGGVLRIFEDKHTSASYYFGEASKGRAVSEDTFFRIASISKMVTAMCVLKLAQQGCISLEEKLGLLPYPANLMQLMTHTAAIKDGADYIRALTQGGKLSEILKGDSYYQHQPGEKWAYSNLGAGLIASHLEQKMNLSFEKMMQGTVFEPLNAKASFYPQLIRGELADARRVLPPAKEPGFDARKRKAKPLGDADIPNPEHHYLLAQGNCCMSAESLQVVVNALIQPGYLNQEMLGYMRHAHAGFGEVSAHLKQGLGLFVLQDESISKAVLYGHQGNAYGAVHAAFFDPIEQKGMVFLSSGVSEARGDFLADVVTDLLKFSFGENQCLN